jgi:hypothetical protein
MLILAARPTDRVEKRRPGNCNRTMSRHVQSDAGTACTRRAFTLLNHVLMASCYTAPVSILQTYKQETHQPQAPEHPMYAPAPPTPCSVAPNATKALNAKKQAPLLRSNECTARKVVITNFYCCGIDRWKDHYNQHKSPSAHKSHKTNDNIKVVLTFDFARSSACCRSGCGPQFPLRFLHPPRRTLRRGSCLGSYALAHNLC